MLLIASIQAIELRGGKGAVKQAGGRASPIGRRRAGGQEDDQGEGVEEALELGLLPRQALELGLLPRHTCPVYARAYTIAYSPCAPRVSRRMCVY